MIGIIFIGDITLCPFLCKYTDELKKRDIKYEIVHWNKSGEVLDVSNAITLNKPSINHRSPFLKIKDFFIFRKFAKKAIKERNYNKLIIFTTMTAIVLYDVLLSKKYKKNYIFDYRDVSYEYIPPFSYLLKGVIKNSSFTSISSKGFLNVLPKNYPYIMAHNINLGDLAYKKDELIKNNKLPIRVSYIGHLRIGRYLFDLIDLFKNDKRFTLKIIGGGDNYKALLEYAKGLDNIRLTGRYKNKERINFLEETDILCYNYPTSFLNQNALANKFYDALIFKKPLWGNLETFSGKLIAKEGVGVSLLNDDKDLLNKIFDYYKKFNPLEFCDNANTLISEILKEEEEYNAKIGEWLTSKKL
ncbi:MAG: hypothetical protein M0R40_01825 [Firmicutes bacterium]|nr:hypothetical protein [Bacillota bacterium]